MAYSLNSSFVNKQEADALKEMIFKRARERAEKLNEEFQQDIMESARNSFVSKNNPFSQIIENSVSANPEISLQNTEKSIEKTEPVPEGLGFPQRQLNSLAAEQGRLVNENVAAAAIQSTMTEARAGLSNKASFMGALNFLNSQGAVSLMRTRSDRFEVVG